VTEVTEPTPEADPLLVRIACGDADAVGACLKRYGPLVWSVVSKAWKDAATIEDLVQEIFIDVWKSAGRFDPAKASEATFIATIARRRVIDRRRRLGRAPELELIEDHEVSQEDAGLSNVDLGDEAQLAREALIDLKPDQRRVILMSVVDGLTHNEIATATGIPLGTVKSHIRRGLDQAAQKLRSARGGAE
jgi:RNA polymerase sigma-70 factor (ECF subfamily)